MNTPTFDVDSAHRYFAAHCFNSAWDLMDQQRRTADQDLEMVGLCQASLWHWTQVPNHTATNLSIGYWQLSRAYALLKDGAHARQYGEACREVSNGEDVEAFYKAYAFEALARAAAVSQDHSEAEEHLREARRIAETVKDEELQSQLLSDLASIG